MNTKSLLSPLNQILVTMSINMTLDKLTPEEHQRIAKALKKQARLSQSFVVAKTDKTKPYNRPRFNNKAGE